MMPVLYVGAVFDVCNAGIYLYEGKYAMAALNMGTAAATVISGMPVAKAASKGLTALGAGAKTAENVGCMIATGVKMTPHFVVAGASVIEGNSELRKGNYLGATLNYVSGVASVFRMLNVGKFCFAEGTQIVVGMEYDPDGNFVSYVTTNIEDIQVGDLVYSYDTATGEVSQKAVTSTSALRSDHINKLTIIDENGVEQVIETTDSHPFWVVTDEPDLDRAAREVVDENGVILYHENLEPGLNGFWVEAKDLKVGDVFLGVNGELSTLINAVRVEQEGGIAVFNFTVEGNHNYYILAKEYEYGQSCILVHNGTCNNPYGRRGSPEHRAKITEVENDYVKQGWKVVAGGKEQEIRTIVDEVTKKYRYADLILEKEGKQIAIQVGRATKNGPVAREASALADLKKVFSNVFFFKYN